MYSQLFSPQNLYSCTTQSERRNSGFSKEELTEKIEVFLGDSINNQKYSFNIKKIDDIYLNAYASSEISHLCQDLVLRKLYWNIKRIYSVEQSDRNRIIKQLSSILNEECDKWVIRLDVKHFFESIDRERLLTKLTTDARLNHQSLYLLDCLFKSPVVKDGKGLPRGISISSALSEIYLKYFDLDVQRMNGVYYYARFVDDIIIVCSTEKSRDAIWNTIPSMMLNVGLELNKLKSYVWNSYFPDKTLTYLGYSFNSAGSKKVVISIAEQKINLIKTRLTKSFVRYAKDGNIASLKNRIKFLTGNFTLYNPSTLLPIKVGIYFNYKMAEDITGLYDLDKYYQNLLHCRTGSLGSRLSVRLNEVRKKELEKYSFVFGFEHHVNHFFTSASLDEITSCWK